MVHWTCGAQLARVVEGKAVARRDVLIARSAWLALCAREPVFPYAVACAPSHSGSILALLALVAPLAVSHAVACKDACPRARGFDVPGGPWLPLVVRVHVPDQVLGVVVPVRAAGAVSTRLCVVCGPPVAEVGDVLPGLADGEAGLAELRRRRDKVEPEVQLPAAQAPALHVLAVVAPEAPAARKRVPEIKLPWSVWARPRLVCARRATAALHVARPAAVRWHEVHVVIPQGRACYAVEPARGRAPGDVARRADAAFRVEAARRANAVRGRCAVDLRVCGAQHTFLRALLALRLPCGAGEEPVRARYAARALARHGGVGASGASLALDRSGLVGEVAGAARRARREAR